MSENLSTGEGKELLALCRAGKLYEIEAWVAAGRSIQVPAELRKTPLQIAVDLGFHSLVRFLAAHEQSQSVKNNALALAVGLRQRELVDLLLEHGAEVTGIPFSDVLLSWEPSLIRLFLNLGADVLTELPFATAFGQRVRTALRPFIEYKTLHPEIASPLQEQIDCALRYFAYEGDLKWVSLLMWAGANPRTAGPRLYEPDEPECYETALQVAVSGDHIEILQRLKPDPSNDDLDDLLTKAAFLPKVDIIEYLLKLGAKPNRKANGGSAAIDTCLWHIHFEGRSPFRSRLPISKYDVHRSFDAIRKLVAHGAIWTPDDRSQLKSVRRTLLECEPGVTVELLRILTSGNACSSETLHELFTSPRLREHLSKEQWWIARLKLKKLVNPPERVRKGVQTLSVSRELLSRYNREELYRKAWAIPMRKLAKEYGVSDVALAKTCRKLLVPVPGRGYWAKKAAGRSPGIQPKLPPVQCN